MSDGCEIRSFDYVNHPYELVRDALRQDALAIFQAATKGAVSRARSVAAELRVSIGGLEIGTDISISVTSIEERARELYGSPTTSLQLEWEAAKSPRLFPFMKAEFSIYPLTATETQLELSGLYKPPLGVLGSAINTIFAHRIAEVSVHRFVADVAAYLRTTLPTTV
jgi:hypothetical protein